MLRNSGLGAHGIQQAEVHLALAAGDIKDKEELYNSPTLT